MKACSARKLLLARCDGQAETLLVALLAGVDLDAARGTLPRHRGRTLDAVAALARRMPT